MIVAVVLKASGFGSVPSETANLPKYRKPPIVEVAMSVQFSELQALRNVHLGMLWNRYRDSYPLSEEHAPLTEAIEKFQPERGTNVSIEMLEQIPVPRLWCMNDPGTRLIQIQQSRFIHNWRKLETDERYPHYPDIRQQFVDAYRTFEAFLAEENLGRPSMNQCEVTYVNHIQPTGWSNHGQAAKVVTVFSPEFSDSFLSAPEDVTMALRYRFLDERQQAIGRLHVHLQPAFRAVDGQPIFVLTLTARGKPKANSLNSVLDFLDVGREWIVRGFTSVTTAEMHKIWERYDD